MSSAGAGTSGGPPTPIKRSDELQRGKMRASKSGPRSGGGGSAKSTDEKLAGQASSEKAAVQTTASTTSTTIAPAEAQVSKLVFGLNPRAHRPQAASAFNKTTTTTTTLNSEQQSEHSDRASGESLIAARFTNNLGAGARANQKSSQSASSANDSGPIKRSSGQTVRASKYGNYYKPQDLAATPKIQTSIELASGSKPAMTKSAANTDQKGAQASKQQQQVQTTSGPERAREPAASSKATSGRPNSVRSTSRSPDRSKQMGRRKSFDEDISTIKIESVPTAAVQQQQCQPQAQSQQQQPILKARTQFNILPPPQLAIATTGKGSVVGYAKSRIYDRPVKQILANPPESTYSALDDQSGQIPASILSGFKPPKQVNVSKAREKWEGGEPFAKCKSRKRLAAQANKKLFPGTWSITSVVATQQLHLQQALAQSASSANHRSNPLETDPSVKVLTRGSVLERVQQFEKVPSGGATGSSPSLLSTSSSCDSLLDYDLATGASGLALSRSSSSLSSTSSSLGSDGGDTVMQQQPQTTADLLANGSTSKQAQYKSLVSSIQQQQQQPVDTLAPQTPPAQQRRLSLRRRSSLGLSRSSSESLIPKFYHPNGKLNTYEMEIRKRDIVACFDKLPERKAQVNTGGPTSRKQFHQIALACGYSEYFKVPLQRYIAHKLETDPKLAQMSSVSSHQLARQRKSSTIALNTNGTSLVRLPLVKAASMDSSTTSPNSAKNSSGGGSPPSNLDKKDINQQFVSCEQFLACWRDLVSCAYDNAAQFIHLLTLGQRNYLTPDDFVPLVQSVIDDHPGLKFLRAAPDFHMRYIQTVIARIYFNVNRSWTGKISLQELRKSNLLAVLMVLGQEEDINQITDYFSYEHFYVIYCKFWNLDQDHDLFISKEDLARHNDAAISSRIIERIFSGIVSKQIQKTGRMSYSDFVWFLIAEEDKKHPRSVEYWFRLMDLDGDGYISMYEMEYFYYEQTKRLELMNIEALPFLDSACQILDLVNPREKNKISLADLKRNKMATIFFDTFINLEKYLEHESREFVSTRDIVQGGVVISDWDRYASEEYENLVTEESTV